MPNDIQQNIAFGVSVVQDIIAAGYYFLNNQQPNRDVVREATERYVRGLFERFGEIKVLGMDRPVSLLNLYVRVNILDKVRSRSGARVEDMEINFDFGRRSFGNKIETKDGEEIANRLQKIIVLGKPGAGKTTFLRFLTISILNEKSGIKRRRLPIYVTLRDWADKRCDLMKYITDQFDICGFELSAPFVECALMQGNCLMLFDGLDEVSQEANLEGIIREIRDFTDKYSGNQFIISCRVAAYHNWFERFTDVEMADFNKDQIEKFIQNWFGAELETAKECLKNLIATPQLHELSAVPLLLTLLCIVYNENKYFPSNRAELYEEALDILLRKWDLARLIRRDDPYKQLSLKHKVNMFSRIAFGTFSENRYFIRERDITIMIEDFINNLSFFNQEFQKVESIEVLHNIETHHGIFVEQARHIYSFAHLTFQEYFTAKFIVDNVANGALEKLVQEHLWNDKWKEVFLLVASMLQDSDKLLRMMLKKNRELLQEPFLNMLMDTIKTLLPSYDGDINVGQKSVAILIMFARARKHADTCMLVSSLALKLAENLGIPTYGDIGLGGYSPEELANNHILACELASSFGIKQSITRTGYINLGRKHQLMIGGDSIRNNTKSHINIIEKIPLFLKGNILIAQSLNTEGYLSKSTREYVLSMMLAPLTEEEKAAMGVQEE